MIHNKSASSQHDTSLCRISIEQKKEKKKVLSIIHLLELDQYQSLKIIGSSQ